MDRGKGVGKGAAGAGGGTRAVPQAQERSLTGAGRPWRFIRPWWRDVQEEDPEYLEMVSGLEAFWTECEERLHELSYSLDFAREARNAGMEDAILGMRLARFDRWDEEDMGFWNWLVRWRNRRASGTGRLRLQRWRGVLYVVDPLTGWWIEETHPDADADIV
jgi:hypothetical protein